VQKGGALTSDSDKRDFFKEKRPQTGAPEASFGGWAKTPEGGTEKMGGGLYEEACITDRIT